MLPLLTNMERVPKWKMYQYDKMIFNFSFEALLIYIS